jgi:hypothetical protein
MSPFPQFASPSTSEILIILGLMPAVYQQLPPVFQVLSNVHSCVLCMNRGCHYNFFKHCNNMVFFCHTFLALRPLIHLCARTKICLAICGPLQSRCFASVLPENGCRSLPRPSSFEVAQQHVPPDATPEALVHDAQAIGP